MAKPNPITKDTPDFEAKLAKILRAAEKQARHNIATGSKSFPTVYGDVIALHDQTLEAAVREKLKAMAASLQHPEFCEARGKQYRQCAKCFIESQLTPTNQKGGE